MRVGEGVGVWVWMWEGYVRSSGDMLTGEDDAMMMLHVRADPERMRAVRRQSNQWVV